MQGTTCHTCGYEFEKPSFGETGLCCPRCGDPASPAAGPAQPAIAIETYVSAALGGAVLGLAAAAILLIGRW